MNHKLLGHPSSRFQTSQSSNKQSPRDLVDNDSKSQSDSPNNDNMEDSINNSFKIDESMVNKNLPLESEATNNQSFLGYCCKKLMTCIRGENSNKKPDIEPEENYKRQKRSLDNFTLNPIHMKRLIRASHENAHDYGVIDINIGQLNSKSHKLNYSKAAPITRDYIFGITMDPIKHMHIKEEDKDDNTSNNTFSNTKIEQLNSKSQNLTSNYNQLNYNPSYESKNQYINETTILQLDDIASCLSQKTKTYFENILNLKISPTLNKENLNTPTFAYGDMDGSFGRVVLSSISAGIISIEDKEIKECLVQLLEAECNGSKDVATLAEFQASDENYKNINKIINHLVSQKRFSSSKNNIVFLGDIVWDRFSCHTSAMTLLLEHLHKNDVVFILGNHDSYNEAKTLGLEEMSKEFVQAGCFAKDKINSPDAMNLEKTVFRNAYYDSESKIFFIHAGIKEENGKLIIGTSRSIDIANYSQYTPEELTEKINSIDFSTNNLGFTEFRPEDKLMEIKYFKDRDITIVHGHSYSNNTENPSVINLNSRDKGGFKPAAVILAND